MKFGLVLSDLFPPLKYNSYGLKIKGGISECLVFSDLISIIIIFFYIKKKKNFFSHKNLNIFSINVLFICTVSKFVNVYTKEKNVFTKVQ